MKVLGIDPGYDRLGIAVVERIDNGEAVLYSDCIETPKDELLHKRIAYLGERFEEVLAKYTPDAVALETLFFNKNITTAIGVAQARGALVYITQKAGCKVLEFGPQEIKVALTGYGKSDKKAMIDMVCRLVKNAPGKALDDEYDAIAVAVTALAHHRG